MALVRWNPFAEIERLRREFDRSLATWWNEGLSRYSPITANGDGWWPAVDLVEEGDRMVLTADLPGMDPKALKVEVRDDQVLLEGRIEEHRSENGDRYWLRERRLQSFRRVVPLPAPTDPDRAEGTFRDGTLRLTLPKVTPAAKGRILTFGNN